MSEAGYVYVWAYRVDPQKIDTFVELYGPAGEWVALFRQAEGYIGTDLYRDVANETRFITIDRWATKSAFDEFKARHATEIDVLDRRGDELTKEETRIA